MDSKDIILYFTDHLSPAVQREILRLRDELDGYEFAIIGYRSSDQLPAEFEGIPVYCYNAEQLSALPYPRKVDYFRQYGIYGSVDLVPLTFFRHRPRYDYYWIIEHDVRFSGKWSTLFSDLSLSAADVLCTTLRNWYEDPDWQHWRSLRFGLLSDPIEQVRLVRGFLPFCRFSRAALETFDACYRSGWAGHFEAVLPTTAMLANLAVEDIGGHGSFTPAERKGRYYVNTPNHWGLFPGTFIFRPIFSDRNLFAPGGQWLDILWHPVKD